MIETTIKAHSVWQPMLTRKLRFAGSIGALTFALLAACSGDFHLSASDLTISPNPAVPGDSVTATFVLSLIPPQSHTVILIIDDTEHTRVESNGAPPIPYILQLGDAAGLIGTYGLGEHTAHVVVHANDEVTRTQSTQFQLEQPAP